MKIVIVGCGKVGENLCKNLSNEEHDIIMIEKNEKLLDDVISKFDVTGICGNGALFSIQEEAGISSCDLCICVTPEDETNIIAAITAKNMGCPTTIARVRDPNYTEQMNFLREKLGIDLMINPELEAARNIAQMLRFPKAVNVESFLTGRVYMLELIIEDKCPCIGKTMHEIRKDNNSVICCIIQRKNGSVIIPNGDTVIENGDHIHVTGTGKDLIRFYAYLGTMENKVRKMMIIGGGKISKHLLPLLENSNISIKLIEKDEKTCQELAEIYNNIEIICADGTNQDLLIEERIENYDAIANLTGIDEENLLLSLFAHKQNIKKIITKVNRLNLIPLLPDILSHSIITPKKTAADHIIRFVRAMANSYTSTISALYRLADEKVEALLFKINNNCRCVDIPLTQLNIKNNILIAYILRNNKLIFPTGNDCLKINDNVFIVTTHNSFNDIDDILTNDIE